MKILYVEDETAHVELTQRTLEDNLQDRFILYHADSLHGALKTLELEPDIDLVLTDLRLPDGSGLDLLKKVKEMQPAPAVVLVTGQGDEQMAVAALKAGAADYLVKEGTYLNRLPAALNNAVAQNRLEREQAALRAAEQRFRVLVEQLPAAVYTDNHDEFSSALYISPQIEEISGYSAKEWLADPKFWLTRLHPDDVEPVLRAIKSTYETFNDFSMDYRILHRSGRVVWVRDVAKVIVDEDKMPKYWQGILFDITKTVEAQATLRASEERFRRIFHSTPIATCVVTVEEGRFIDANQAFQNLVGASLDHLIGHTSMELGFWASDQDRDRLIAQLREQGTLQGLDVRYTNVPNGPRETLAFYELIELGGEDSLLAMFYDVTEQNKTQKALQSERDFALQVLNNMGQGLTVLDKSGRFEYVNPAYAGMLGYRVEELMNKEPADVTAAADHALLAEELTRRQKGIGSTYESNLVHQDGHEVPVVITGVPRLQNGELNGAIAVITDLTVQKLAEVALERQVRELTTLHAVATAEAESTSEDEIIEKVTVVISQIYSEVCGILLLDGSGNFLTPHPSYFGANITDWQNGYPITEGLSGKSAFTGKILRIGDISKEPGYIEIATAIRSELCVPIRVHDRVIGVINVESKSMDAFTEHDEGFLTTIANGLGTTLEKIRLFNEERRRAKELNTLYLATKSLAESLEPTAIANKLVVIIDDLLGYESASIHVVDEQGQFLTALAIDRKLKDRNQYHIAIEQLVDKPRALGKGMIDWVIQNGKPIRSGNVASDPRYMEVVKGIQSELCVPLIARGRVIGAINLETIVSNAYSEADENLISALANSAAIALENARLFESERKRRQEAENLRQAATAISSTLDLDAVVTEILAALKQVIPYDSGTVFFLEGEHLRIAMAKGYTHSDRLKNRIFAGDDALFQLIKKTGRPLIVEDVQKDPRFKNWGDPADIHGWMAVPLIARGRVIGYISLDSHLINAYDEGIGETAMAFAHQAAAAVDNARLYDETQRRLSEMEIINRVAASLRLALALEEIVQILLNEALQLMDTSHGSIWLYEPATNSLRQRAARGAESKLAVTALQPGEGIVGHVFASGEKYITSDLKTDRMLSAKNRESMQPGLSGFCIPIKSTVGPLGALTVSIEKGRQFPGEINLLTILAEITGNAIYRAELFEHSQEQVHRLTTLRDIDSAIASSTDLRVTLNILMDHTLKHLKVDAMDIMLYHPELQSLTYLCSAGFYNPSPSRPLIRLGEGLAGQVVMKGSIEHIEDLRSSTEGRRDPLLIREGFTTYFGVPLIVKGQIKGVFEIFGRSFVSPTPEWMQFLQTLAGQAAIAIDNAQLFDNLQRSNQEITQAYDTTLEGWARALELRDRETEGHTRRVTDLTMQLARYMNIPDEDHLNIYRGVLLHDIGKMGVPDQILRKPGPLTEAEWIEMRKHPEYAYDLLSRIPYLRPALDIPYCHHEHWDGSGYPRGLKGEQIPLSARIFSIVDIWDALLSDRPYRKAWSKDKVIEHLKEISGKILDPKVVIEFLKLISE